MKAFPMMSLLFLTCLSTIAACGTMEAVLTLESQDQTESDNAFGEYTWTIKVQPDNVDFNWGEPSVAEMEEAVTITANFPNGVASTYQWETNVEDNVTNYRVSVDYTLSAVDIPDQGVPSFEASIPPEYFTGITSTAYGAWTNGNTLPLPGATIMTVDSVSTPSTTADGEVYYTLTFRVEDGSFYPPDDSYPLSTLAGTSVVANGGTYISNSLTGISPSFLTLGLWVDGTTGMTLTITPAYAVTAAQGNLVDGYGEAIDFSFTGAQQTTPPVP